MLKKEFSLSRAQTLTYLAGPLHNTGNTGNTLYIPAGLSPEQIAAELSPLLTGQKLQDVKETVQRSQTGACVVIEAGTTVILPPFPIKQRLTFQGRDVSLLEIILKRDSLLSVVLIRLGAYAIGVCRGDSIISSKVGTGLVHGRHRQGGSSANRFRRHREKQMETFFIRVCGHIKEHFGPYVDVFEYAVFGGARTTVELLQKDCPILQKLEDRLLPSLLDIPDPRQYVLEEAVTRLWSSRVIEFREEEV